MGCALRRKWRLVARVREGEGALVVNDATKVSGERYDSKWHLEPFVIKLEAVADEGWEFSHFLVCTRRCVEVVENPVEIKFPQSSTRLNVVSVRAYFVKAEQVFDPWQYDRDDDGEVSQDEMLEAVKDYCGGSITGQQAIMVMSLYFQNE